MPEGVTLIGSSDDVAITVVAKNSELIEQSGNPVPPINRRMDGLTWALAGLRENRGNNAH